MQPYVQILQMMLAACFRTLTAALSLSVPVCASLHITLYLCMVWVCLGTWGFYFSCISLQCSSTKQTQRFVFMAQLEHRAKSSSPYLTPTLALFLFLTHFSCRSALCLSSDSLSCFACFWSLSLVLSDGFQHAFSQVPLQFISASPKAVKPNNAIISWL